MKLVGRGQKGSLGNTTELQPTGHTLEGWLELLVRKREDCMSSWKGSSRKAQSSEGSKASLTFENMSANLRMLKTVSSCICDVEQGPILGHQALC